MKVRRARYQQGSIRKVSRATGFAWEIRFSEIRNGKRYQKTQTLDGAEYPTEKEARRAIELTVSQVNAGAGSAKADVKFSYIAALYRTEHLAELEHVTIQHNTYLLRDYIEPRFGNTYLRDMKPLDIDRWLKSLTVSASLKAAMRSVLSVCFRLAALHEYILPMQQNPMALIKIKGVTKRQKKISEITIEQFRSILSKMPEPLNIMTLIDGAFGLRIS